MKLIKFYNDGAQDAIISNFSQKFNIDKKVIEIIFSKGYKTEESISTFLNPLNQPFVDPYKLQGMKQCVEKIINAVKLNKKILIFGDYDVDGISATYIMLKTLSKLGNNATYYLPNRFVDGYGLTIQVLDKIFAKGKPDLIITVDCGISCYNEVEYCKNNGVDIIITDHHEIPEVIPNCIVVNPKIENQEYTFNGLCGTGVAFKIAQALTNSICEDLLPIAAIATIADIVPLREENRVIVAKGLKLFNEYLPYGLKVMFKQNKLKLDELDAGDITFKIAPKLNSSGRMNDASDSLKLMLETDPIKIKVLLEKINGYNTKRQELCNQIFDECMEMLKDINMSTLPAIILKSDHWDHGILGIVCSRILEIYNRPVILLSQIGDELKGSARSIEDVNIHQVLSSVKELLEVFGGHKVAAGLTLKIQHYEEFCNKVYSYIFQNINLKAFIPIEYYDVELTSDDLTEKLYNDLALIEPCGCENQKPRFMIKTPSIQITPLKPNSLHAYIGIEKKLNLIFFNYLKHHPRLNFGKEYHFIFELQGCNKSFKGDIKSYKGVVKTFTSSDDIRDNANKYFNAFKLNQFLYLNNQVTCNKVYTYDDNDLLNFLVDCSSSILGTCFVCFNVDKYKKFITNYDLTNIYEINFIDTKITGFNAINLCPINLDFAKNYSKIIFLDSVLDITYLNEIAKISNAEIYIPKLDNEDKELFNSLNLDRKEISNFYINLLKVEKNLFTSIISIHSKLVKDCKYKISFNNFLVYFYILSELKIIKTSEKEGLFSFKINKKIKTDLKKSLTYNKLNLIRRIYE